MQPRSGLGVAARGNGRELARSDRRRLSRRIRVPAGESRSVEAFKISRGDRIAELVIDASSRSSGPKWTTSMIPNGAWAAGAPPAVGGIGSRLVTDRPFRFGVIVPKSGSGKELTEQARKAEALGFSSFFVPDHFIDHDLAPTVALAHVAAVTETLRVGPLVLGNDYKLRSCCGMATLDLLSDGRLELGIGAGWMTADYEKAGMPLDRAGVRIARLAESITSSRVSSRRARSPFTATTTRLLISTACRNRRRGRTSRS